MDKLMNYQEYLHQNMKTMGDIDSVNIENFVSALRRLASLSGTLWIAGNGGSAATASHCVADFMKTTLNFDGTSLKSVALHELVSLTSAYSNDVSFEESLGLSLELVAEPGDALLIISVSGLSPNLIYAHAKAKKLGMRTFALVGERGRSLAENCDDAILVQSDDYQIVENAHVMLMHWVTKNL
jgi:D-sedoheptulose 7-phosphate isomerase